MKAGDTLSIWTVYDHPTDYPEKFVARRFDVDGDGARPSGSVIIAPDLEMLRIILMEMGLTCLNRNDEDEPQIVESWL